MRYFIVFYQASKGTSTFYFGYMTLTLHTYPNSKITREEILKTSGQGANSVVITNIIELNEIDFIDFVKK